MRLMHDVKDKKDIPPIINALASANLVVLLILSDLLSDQAFACLHTKSKTPLGTRSVCLFSHLRTSQEEEVVHPSHHASECLNTV